MPVSRTNRKPAAPIALIAFATAACGRAAERQATVETVDHTHVGVLAAIDREHLRLSGDSFLTLPLGEVLRVGFENGRRPPQPPGGRVELIDRSRIRFLSYKVLSDRIELSNPASRLHSTVPTGSVAAWFFDESIAEANALAAESDGASDTLWVRSRRSPQPRAVDGIVVKLSNDAVEFALDPDAVDSTTPVPWSRVVGLRFYRSLASKPPPPACRIELVGGSRLAAAEVNVDRLETISWTSRHSEGRAAFGAVDALDLSAGRVTHARDLSTLDAGWRPYFADEPLSEGFSGHRFDAAIDGRTLALTTPDPRLPSAWPEVAVKREYKRGVALQSRGHVAFALPPGARWLKGLVGIDPATRRVGAAEVTVLADRRVLFKGVVDGSTRPVEISKPLDGAERLELRVDFGPNLDTGDRVHFAELRVIQ